MSNAKLEERGRVIALVRIVAEQVRGIATSPEEREQGTIAYLCSEQVVEVFEALEKDLLAGVHEKLTSVFQ